MSTRSMPMPFTPVTPPRHRQRVTRRQWSAVSEIGPMSRSCDRDLAELRVVEAALGLRHPVDEAVVAPVVALQDAAHHVGRQPVVERHVQQRDAGGLRRPWSRARTPRCARRCGPSATSTSRSEATRCFVPRSSAVALDPARQVAGDAAAIDDRDRSPVDAVARVAVHLGDGRVEVGEHLHRAIADDVASGAGRRAPPARAVGR